MNLKLHCLDLSIVYCSLSIFIENIESIYKQNLYRNEFSLCLNPLKRILNNTVYWHSSNCS